MTPAPFEKYLSDVAQIWYAIYLTLFQNLLITFLAKEINIFLNYHHSK